MSCIENNFHQIDGARISVESGQQANNNTLYRNNFAKGTPQTKQIMCKLCDETMAISVIQNIVILYSYAAGWIIVSIYTYNTSHKICTPFWRGYIMTSRDIFTYIEIHYCPMPVK